MSQLACIQLHNKSEFEQNKLSEIIKHGYMARAIRRAQHRYGIHRLLLTSIWCLADSVRRTAAISIADYRGMAGFLNNKQQKDSKKVTQVSAKLTKPAEKSNNYAKFKDQ